MKVTSSFYYIPKRVSIHVRQVHGEHLPLADSGAKVYSLTAQAYVKVTVYVNNTILCWRRSGPQAVAAMMEVEEDLALHMPELDLDATHLVLSVRLRTRPGRSVASSLLPDPTGHLLI